MQIKKVTAHKMFEEFHQFPVIQYVGENNNLVRLFNSLNQQLTRIIATYQ